jgi:hypothetical protein
MTIRDDELQRYAAVIGAVAEGTPLAEVLVAHGLDEASFDALETRIEGELDEALAVSGDTPADFVLRYERAVRLGQSGARHARGSDAMPFERFAEALATLGSGGDAVERLAAMGIEPRALVDAANAHAARLSVDPALVAALERALSRRAR